MICSTVLICECTAVSTCFFHSCGLRILFLILQITLYESCKFYFRFIDNAIHFFDGNIMPIFFRILTAIIFIAIREIKLQLSMISTVARFFFRQNRPIQLYRQCPIFLFITSLSYHHIDSIEFLFRIYLLSVSITEIMDPSMRYRSLVFRS